MMERKDGLVFQFWNALCLLDEPSLVFSIGVYEYECVKHMIKIIEKIVIE